LSFHYITKILAVSALAALQWKGWMEPYKLSEDDKKDERVFSGKHLNAAIHTCLYAATLGAAMFTLFDPYAHARSPWSFLELLHVTLSLAASGLRVWSIYALGRHFTFEVGITKDHELIGTGPYKYLRHPSYTGALLGPYGFVWFLGWRSMLFWVPTLSVAAALLVARIQNEEETMAEHFKDTWKAYAAKRWRLIPFVY
jgi:protein-S-isoprenylcysteine O-methyltransferase